MIRMCFAIKRRFEAAEQHEQARPDVVAMIETPRLMSDNARDHCLHVMRKSGEMRPTLCLFSRYKVAMICIENMPATFDEEVRIAGPLRVLLATAPIEAYWFATEMWAANLTDGLPEEIRALGPRDRPDRREGMLVNTATRTAFLPRYFDTHRHDGRAPLELVEQMDFAQGAATTIQNLVMRDLFEGASEIMKRAFEKLKG